MVCGANHVVMDEDTEMSRKDLERAAESYSHLRGLLSVPLGALMIAAALGNWEWGPLRHAWVFLLCAAAAGAAAVALSRFYDARYGRVTSTTRNQVRVGLWTAAVAALVLGGSLLARSEASWSLDLPVNGLAATLALGLLTYFALTVGPQRHHLVVWGALLVAGLLPVWGGLSVGDTANAGLALGGAAAIVSGVLDHRLLARRLEAARGLDLSAGRP